MLKLLETYVGIRIGSGILSASEVNQPEYQIIEEIFKSTLYEVRAIFRTDENNR